MSAHRHTAHTVHAQAQTLPALPGAQWTRHSTAVLAGWDGASALQGVDLKCHVPPWESDPDVLGGCMGAAAGEGEKLEGGKGN